jgi:hypothetical protein
MLINELTIHELKQIIEPVIQLQSMSHVISRIGEVIGIPQPTRETIEKQKQFLLRYKGFEVFFFDLRWLRARGPSIRLQFRRPATRLQSLLENLFPKSHRLMDMVCGEVIGDLKSICLDEIKDIEVTSTDVNAQSWLGSEAVGFRVTYPRGAFNYEWKQGYDIAPLMISDESHSDKWFISFSFNPGAFVRNGERTRLRENWQNYAGDISKSIDAWVARNYHPDDPRRKSFEEWSEDMILDLGDEIIPKLPAIWETIHVH